MAALLYPHHHHHHFAHQAHMSLESPPYQYAESPYGPHYSQQSPSWYANAEYSDYMNLPQAHGREALSKATKDLMSLDADRWRPSSAVPALHHPHHPELISRRSSASPYYDQRLSAYDRHSPYPPQQPPQQRRTVTFPFLQRDRTHSMSHQLAMPPHPADLYFNDSGNGYPGSPPNTASSTASTSSFSFSNTPPIPSPPLSSSIRSSRSPSAPILPSKRGSIDSTGSSSPLPSRRSRVHTSMSPRPSTSSSTGTSPSPSSGGKPTLLSASQKKANHIQSEQKRRANIRRGYEALCDTVPALREAIRAEEQVNNVEADNGNRKSKRSRKGKEEAESSTKADGRAGPRSENVVLVKTIEYITDMLSEKDSLMARLHAAREQLGPSHPALAASPSEPLWEREWKGGEGAAEGSEDDDEEDS